MHNLQILHSEDSRQGAKAQTCRAQGTTETRVQALFERARIQQRRTLVRKSTIYLFVLGLAVVTTTALVSAGLVVSAQNSNSSTTMAPANTAAKKKTPARHKAKAKA